MEKLSVTLTEDQVEAIDEAVQAGEYDSRSEAIRERLEDADRLEQRVDDLETDVKHAEARADELEKQAQQARQHGEDVTDLATFADVERRRARRRERLEDARRQAGLVERARWKLFGEPEDLEQRVDDVVEDVDEHDRAGAGREQ